MARSKTKKGLLAEPEFSFLGSKDEIAQERTVESRKRLREVMDNQVEEFLKRGGKIEVVTSDTNITANKQTANYGSRPI